jgi:hypothetical protein
MTLTLNAELNTICHLLALLVAHHILHVSGVRVKEKRCYWKLKEEVLDCIVGRTGLVMVYGIVIRRTAE